MKTCCNLQIIFKKLFSVICNPNCWAYTYAMQYLMLMDVHTFKIFTLLNTFLKMSLISISYNLQTLTCIELNVRYEFKRPVRVYFSSKELIETAETGELSLNIGVEHYPPAGRNNISWASYRDLDRDNTCTTGTTIIMIKYHNISHSVPQKVAVTILKNMCHNEWDIFRYLMNQTEFRSRSTFGADSTLW